MKKLICTRACVTIEVPSENYGAPRDYASVERELRSLIDDIKRHIDLPGEINWDTEIETVCSFCRLDWSNNPESSAERPICCSKAGEEWDSDIEKLRKAEEERRKTAVQKIMDSAVVEAGRVKVIKP